MTTQIEELNKVEINATLTADETKAIDAVKALEGSDKTNFLNSLKTGTISVDGEQKTMKDVINSFNTQVIYKDGKFQAVAGKTLDTWVSTFIADPTASNDVAYVVTTINYLSDVDNVIITDKIDTGLKAQMRDLLKTIKGIATESDDAVIDTSSITADDIEFDGYGVTAEEIAKAATDLPETTDTEKVFKKTIIKGLKKGDVKGVQITLGMTEDGSDLYHLADNMFGPKTLANLKAKGVIDAAGEITPAPAVDASNEDAGDDVVSGLTMDTENPETISKINSNTKGKAILSVANYNLLRDATNLETLLTDITVLKINGYFFYFSNLTVAEKVNAFTAIESLGITDVATGTNDSGFDDPDLVDASDDNEVATTKKSKIYDVENGKREDSKKSIESTITLTNLAAYLDVDSYGDNFEKVSWGGLTLSATLYDMHIKKTFESDVGSNLVLRKTGEKYFILPKNTPRLGKKDALKLEFTDIHEALRTAAFIDYMQTCVEGRESGANEVNENPDYSDSDESAFFEKDKVIYFSEAGGSSDVDLITINKLQTLSSIFINTAERNKLMKFLNLTSNWKID